jgi:hypothetical protein
MMIAKQTYQLAVAQQAMGDAGEEWEHGSVISMDGTTAGQTSADQVCSAWAWASTRT